MHVIVDNVTVRPEVDRVYHLIVSIVLVSIEILSLSSVACWQISVSFALNMEKEKKKRKTLTLTRVVEKQRVVWLRALNKPVHSTDDVVPCGLRHGILRIICKEDHL